jgi:hypothetical protein
VVVLVELIMLVLVQEVAVEQATVLALIMTAASLLAQDLGQHLLVLVAAVAAGLDKTQVQEVLVVLVL